MSTVPSEEPLRSGVDSVHRSIQEYAKEDASLEVIDTGEARESLPPLTLSLTTYLDDLGRVIAGNYSSPATNNDPKELVFTNENPAHLAPASREAQVDRIFHDALSRNGPIPNSFHEEADTDCLAYPSTGAESVCAPGCTKCGVQIVAPYPTKLLRKVHSSLSKQNRRIHSIGVDAVDPLLLDTSSQTLLEDYLALHAPFEPEPDDGVAELNIGTNIAEDVKVDPGNSVPAVEKKGQAKTRRRTRKRKSKGAQSPKENKDDAKENVPEIPAEPTKDPLRWIRDLAPMIPLSAKEIRESIGRPEERPSEPLSSDEVEWMKEIMKAVYGAQPRHKLKRN